MFFEIREVASAEGACVRVIEVVVGGGDAGVRWVVVLRSRARGVGVLEEAPAFGASLFGASLSETGLMFERWSFCAWKLETVPFAIQEHQSNHTSPVAGGYRGVGCRSTRTTPVARG